MLASIVTLLLVVLIGSPLAVIRLNQAQQDTLQNLDRAVRAEGIANRKLWDSYVAQSRANRLSGQLGQRFKSLNAVRNASALARRLEFTDEDRLRLRNEAIQCMALADLRTERHWVAQQATLSPQHLAFDSELSRYAIVEGQGNRTSLVVRTVSDNREEARFTDLAAAVLSIQFMPDGKAILALLKIGGTGSLRRCELSSGTSVELARFEDTVPTDFDISAGGETVALSLSGSVRLLDGASRTHLKQLPASSGYTICRLSEWRTKSNPWAHRDKVQREALAFSVDGSMVAMAHSPLVIHVIDPKTMAELAHFRPTA